MKKRIIAILLVLAMALSLMPQVAFAAETKEAAQGSYKVGYAKADINPYADGTGENQELLPLPLNGFGDNATRLARPNKLDDNGDGKVDANDGIFATCIAVTDKAGNTALFFNLDLLWGAYDVYTLPVLQELLTGEDYAQYGLAMDRIYFNGSHDHFAPAMGTVSNDFEKYNEMLAQRLLAAAKEALEDRAWADMYQGSVDVSDYFNENNKARRNEAVGDLLNALRSDPSTHVTEKTYKELTGDVEDIFFNCVRHYRLTEQKIATNADGSLKRDSNGKYIVAGGSPVYEVYVGNGTNSDWGNTGWTRKVYNYDPVTGEQLDLKETRVILTDEPATETDDRLDLVEFRFKDTTRKSVVMLNWQGHLVSNSNLSPDSYYQVSSCMVNALRYALLQNGYRVSFFQGQGGNINMQHLGSEGAWMRGEGVTINGKTYYPETGNIYGTELAQIALYVLKNDMEQINKDGGKIQSTQQILTATYPEITVFEYMAGLRYMKAYNDAGYTGTKVFADLYYYTDAEGNPLINTTTGLPTTDANGYTNGTKVGITKYVAERPIVLTDKQEADVLARNYVNSGKEYQDVTLNAMKIGKDFSLVAVSAELFDHYIGENGENLWDTLAADKDHGTAFVMGYTNSPGGGYMPDKNTYHYGEEPTDAAYIIDETYDVGTYESRATSYAEGTGEEVVKQLDIMLDFLDTDPEAQETGTGYCDHCGKLVQWTDLYQEVTAGKLQHDRYIYTGHYYVPSGLTEDQKTVLVNKTIPVAATVCLDLNGQTLYVEETVIVEDTATLSIVDSSTAGTGAVEADKGDTQGGAFHVKNGGTLNLYNGKLYYRSEEDGGTPAEGQSSGGILYVHGTFNMYGGLIQGTAVYHAAGAIRVDVDGTANFRGGTVQGGSLTGPQKANGNCVTSTGKALLGGDACIASLFGLSSSKAQLYFEGNYTGKSVISGYLVDTKIGEATDKVDASGKVLEKADVSLASITFSRTVNGTTCWYFPQFELNEAGTYDVCMRLSTDYAAQNSETGEFIYGDYVVDSATVDADKTLTNVIGTLPENSRVVLLGNNTPSNLTLNINENLYLELKGKTFNGSVNVADGKTLYVLDSATADYDITDGQCGRLIASKVSGNVKGAPTTTNSDAYVKAEGNSYLTFHAVDLNIDQMVLRADAQGIYFKHQFVGDETAKQQIESYGIAFSLSDAPAVDDLMAESTKIQNLDNNVQIIKAGDVIYTKFNHTDIPFGSSAASTSTLITGIMKEENGYLTNKRNAAMPIYGTAYVKLTTGDYILGVTRQRSLQEQVEGIDAGWEKLNQTQRNSVLRMYKISTYNDVMKTWELPNLTDPEKTQTPDEQKILRVLSIGNSHTVDATDQLYKVFKAEMPDQEVMIANMYYSGCSVSQHVQFAQNNSPVYVYYTNSNNSWKQQEETTLEYALHDQVWDVIILHEMNNSAGRESTYTGSNRQNLQKHINYVKTNSLNSEPTLIWNFSWANPTSETLWDLGYPGDWVGDYQTSYNLNYDNMLSQMIAMTKQYVMTNEAFSDVAPTGLAFKCVRDNNPAEDKDLLLYRDYTHVTYDFGRLMAAYVWYATITGQESISEIKTANTLTDANKTLMLRGINYALDNKGTLLPN